MTAMIRVMWDSPSVHLVAFVLLVCSTVCIHGSSCYSKPGMLNCVSDFVEFDVRVVHVARHSHYYAVESGIERIDSHTSRQRRRPIVASASASLASVEAWDLVRIRMALQPRWRPPAAMKRQNLDRRRRLHRAMRMSVVDVCLSCVDSGTKPEFEIQEKEFKKNQQTNEFGDNESFK